ncbi:MAG: regulatory iron-sulfur-containing complex subunit RicT [Phycisphaerae bacterium]|nr:regulatory iron-sulfur-containing complex subunit RicT [Phycisphaerae bacterium]
MNDNNIEAKQKPKHNPAEKKMLVRYGKTGTVGWFTHEEKNMPKAHSKVMIKTERGLEIGEVVGRFCYKAGVFKKTEDAVVDYYGQGVENCPITVGGRFVRYATEQDLADERHVNSGAKQELDKCRLFIKELNLPMKPVDIEHVFGGERIIFYFTAETRIDFRELVKRLAKEFQTRIEMRQVGSRDAAKIAADIEVCGQPCCCARFLKILKPVNMKMAKLQKATLDPAKISGYCGRLKCCLRYEDHTYRDLVRRLPRKRTRVKTAHGEGIVVDAQILTQLVSIKTDDGTIFAVPLEEIEILESPPREPQVERTDKPAQERPSGEEIPDDFDTEDINDREPDIDFDEPEDEQDKPEQ